MRTQIGILGAGGWGTALALLLQQNGHAASIWEYREDLALRLKETRRNPDFLPGVEIPKEIEISSNLEFVAAEKDMLLITLPTHVVRSAGEKLAGIALGRALVVSGCKGIENRTLKRMSEVLTETVPDLKEDRIIILSGPSHAEEVARGVPTVVVAASKNRQASEKVQELFMNPVFRVYSSEDVIGVELGGALKNCIAIAAGISDGVGFGDNTKAALITRGIVEMTRLGKAMGANPVTFAGLSGMGDLIVTCTSRHSRNRYVGEQIGKGKTLKDVLDGMIMVAEGVRTTQSAVGLARKYKVEIPITQEVFEVLFHRKDPKKAVFDLMTRNPKGE